MWLAGTYPPVFLCYARRNWRADCAARETFQRTRYEFVQCIWETLLARTHLLLLD